MSDFLTNLVMRSFSGAPSVQPVTLSTYATPEATHEPAAESFDPFIEQTTSAEQPAAAPRRQLVDRQQVSETPADPVQAADTPESFETTSAGTLAELPSVSDAVVPEIHTQTPEPAKPLFEQESVSPPVSKRRKLRAQKTSTEKSAGTERSSEPPVRRVAGSSQGEQKKRALPAATSDEQPTTSEITVSKPETKTEIRPAQLIYRTPIATVQPVTRRITRKPANATSSSADPTPSPVSREETPARRPEPDIVEHVVERPAVTIEKRQQVTTSFTTLIPKTSPQPLPALNLKSRQSTPPRDLPEEAEAPAPAPETVINVAIGRIEVRATPAAMPQRERQQHGPKVMTLDDYLQQRSRGTQ